MLPKDSTKSTEPTIPAEIPNILESGAESVQYTKLCIKQGQNGKIVQNFELSEDPIANGRAFATADDYTVYINPSLAEVREMVKSSQYKASKTRCIVDRGGMGNLYMASGDMNHGDLIQALTKPGITLKGELLDLYYEYKRKEIYFSKFTEAITRLYDRDASNEPGADRWSGYADAVKKIDSFWGKNILRNKAFKNIGVRRVDSDLSKGI